jgi:hypothetical protein
MNEIRYNKSKTYLLPLLAEVVDIDTRFFNNLVNTYVLDANSLYKNCIFILHNFSFKNPAHTAYEHKLTKNEHFIDFVDINNQVLYIFKFPEEYLIEYNLFKEGKYSEFGKDAKGVILNFFGNIYAGNLNAVKFLMKLKQILYKDLKLKQEIEKNLNVILSNDAELTDTANLEEETFEITKVMK